jgi:hypothetical protein
MSERDPRHIALGILGLLGALLYVLSCSPAWSPDSSKVLFPYTNPETKEQGVALYDRNSGAVRSIFSRKSGGADADELLSTAWSGDGLRAIILWGETTKKKRKNPSTRKTETVDITLGHVEVLPVGRAGKGLHVKLRHFEPGVSLYFFPLAESQGKLYLSGKDSSKVLQLNLKSGKQKIRNLEGDSEEPVLYSHNGHIAYARAGAENSDDIEFGELDTKDLSLHSWFVLKKESLDAQGVSEFEGFVAFEPRGSRMAMPAEGADDKARILMCNARGLEQVIKPELQDPAFRLGNLEWSRDGKTLYATVITPSEKEGTVQYSLGEIPIASGPVHVTPIVRASLSLDESLGQFQISISPDGSTSAGSTARFAKGKIDPANRGLFLVDLRDPERKVTRIQYPLMTGEKKTARE